MIAGVAGYENHPGQEAPLRPWSKGRCRMPEIKRDAALAVIDLAGRRWPAEEVHALSLANMHGEYADVATTAELLAALEEG